MGFLKNIFGTPDEEEYYDIEDNEGYDVSSSAVTDEEASFGSVYTPPQSSFGGSKAINIHSGSNASKITVMKPKHFVDMMNEAITGLREGTIIFLNLTETVDGEGARIVDFMTGAAAMCGGRVQKVDTCCYAVAPKGVEWVNTIED